MLHQAITLSVQQPSAASSSYHTINYSSHPLIDYTIHQRIGRQWMVEWSINPLTNELINWSIWINKPFINQLTINWLINGIIDQLTSWSIDKNTIASLHPHFAGVPSFHLTSPTFLPSLFYHSSTSTLSSKKPSPASHIPHLRCETINRLLTWCFQCIHYFDAISLCFSLSCLNSDREIHFRATKPSHENWSVKAIVEQMKDALWKINWRLTVY